MTIFTKEYMLRELKDFDPLAFKYYYGKDQKEIKEEIVGSSAGARKYERIVEYEKSHQFSCLTKRKYDDDYANLNLVYGERQEALRNINILELILNKVISQYINIDGMERLFSDTYIEFEWEMHLSADYEKHNMKYYRDHFFHQVRDTYMMFILLRDHGFYEYVKHILLNESESKVSRFVCRSLVQQKYYESDKLRELREDDQDFYIRNMIYMASFMAGLFHDIGYPEEYYLTTSRQIREYIASIHELNAEGSNINRIYSLLQNSLLFRVEPLENIEKRLTNRKKSDHGALSAIIFLLHFYENGAIYRLSPYKIAAVELAALAIYNHTNKYGIQGKTDKKYNIYRPCFSLNPISYLLRICDDLQEWERIYFVISSKSNIVFCNTCKTPIIGYEEKIGTQWTTRYRCNCQFLGNSRHKLGNRHEADHHVQAFDGDSKFSYRRIYNISVCDWLKIEESTSKKKILITLHYDPYKLLHVAYLNQTYAKYRISELNQLKKLFECHKEIPRIYLNYFVTSNPIHIKVNLLKEYLEFRKDVVFGEETLEEIFIGVNEFDAWRKSKVEEIILKIGTIQREFLKGMPMKKIDRAIETTYKKEMNIYLTEALDLYANLLVYQYVNGWLNSRKQALYTERKANKFEDYKESLLKSEWNYMAYEKGYLELPELRCMIEDCFLQFTKMYQKIEDFVYFPDAYYQQYENAKREKIFVDRNGEDLTGGKKYSNESEEYYYKALTRYLDAELYRPLAMRITESNQSESDVGIDAYTDLYLFYLMDREIKEGMRKLSN